MKKTLKNLLLGAGVAAVGLFVYSLWKDAEEPTMVQDTNSHSASTTLPKEYVERRRQHLREAAEAIRTAQREAAAVSSEEEMLQDGKPLREASEKPEEGSTPIAEQDAEPIESAPLEEAEEQQEEL